MAHLFPPPYDTELQYCPPRTPWLGYTQHDGYPLSRFGDYPAARGWDKSQIDNEDENAPWKRDGAIRLQMLEMLQSWLYFGYLEAVTKEVVPVTALVREQDESAWLCTRTLPEILRRFQNRLYEAGAGESRQRWAREIKEASSEAVQWANDLSFAPRMERQLPGGFRILMPAIVILYEAVERAIRGAFAHCTDLVAIMPARMNTELPLEAWAGLRARMREAGWCPRLVRALKARTSFSLLEFAYARTPGSRCNEQHVHQDCSIDVCQATIVNVQAYQARHRQPPCVGAGCPHVRLPVSEVVNVLKRERIPLVALNVTETDPDTVLRLVECEFDTKYVAVSHVWAHGLGGTTETGLPICQLARLARLAKSILKCPLENALFWIDSMCIPGAPEARGLAISQLGQVYKNACAVLVVDDSISLVGSATSPLRKDMMLTILASDWMHRLWTFQEGLLARTLYFEMHELLFELPIPAYNTDILGLDVILQNLVLGTWIYHTRQDSTIHELTVGDVFNSLQWRTTSKPEDETLAVSALLGIDSRPLLAVTTAESRMRLFWLSLRHLPPSIIFLDHPKMEKTPGFSWAPASMLSSAFSGTDQTLSQRKNTYTATCTTEGLFAVYNVFLPHGDAAWSANTPAFHNLLDTNLQTIFSIFTPPRGQLYVDTPLGKQRLGTPQAKPSSYDWNAVLFDGVVKSTTHAAVVRISGESRSQDGEVSLLCRYDGRVIIEGRPSRRRDIPIVEGQWQQRRVCVV